MLITITKAGELSRLTHTPDIIRTIHHPSQHPPRPSSAANEFGPLAPVTALRQRFGLSKSFNNLVDFHCKQAPQPVHGSSCHHPQNPPHRPQQPLQQHASRWSASAPAEKHQCLGEVPLALPPPHPSTSAKAKVHFSLVGKRCHCMRSQPPVCECFYVRMRKADSLHTNSNNQRSNPTR